MKPMKANGHEVIHLRKLIPNADAWGNDQGREVFGKLLKHVESRPGQQLFAISLEKVEKTDASFPRESVIELARRFSGEKAFFLIGLESNDLKFNWGLAAEKREQPIFIWRGDKYEILGPMPKEGSLELLKYVIATGPSTTSSVAKKFDQPANSVSNKLKQLAEAGFLLRKEQAADSGGIEFVYSPIR
jgi:hypothetical protein